ncbi:MAG: hypothetical protein KAI81_06835, partial [Candidatus Marinimicrobia bacterium]|nr:hypothetical protein [Candidatus Neomarinimicrobiota bacterium]
MKKLAIIGKNISYSLSPDIFRMIAELKGLDLSYDIRDIDNSVDIENHIKDLDGFNITIPYKNAILPCLNETSPDVKFTDACNCVTVNNGIRKGVNTDINAFTKAFIHHIPNYKDYDIVLIGNGGAARAVAASLINLNITTFQLLGRSSNKVHSFILKFHKELQLSEFLERKNKPIIWINSSPVHPSQFTSPLPLQKNDIIYHLSYRFSEKRGSDIIEYNGLDMLINQALVVAEIWFPGLSFSPEDKAKIRIALAKDAEKKEIYMVKTEEKLW